MRIAILGGTGKEGGGLAARWHHAGHSITIGSRDGAKARARAAELGVAGADNLTAAAAGELVVLAVPYAAHADTLRAVLPALAGKVLLDLTVPLRPPRVTTVCLPAGGAAALEAQAIVGPATPVIAALHHVSHVHLADPSVAIRCDVLVAGTDPQAKELVMGAIRDLGLRALDAGPLDNAVALESLTPVLIHLNKRYRSAGTGIVFTGLPD